MKQLKEIPFMGTLYSSCKQQKGEKLLTLQQWMEIIRSRQYQSVVETYRAYKQQGRDDEARILKQSLPGFVCSCQCLDGRKEACITGLSGIVMADYDCHDLHWSGTLCQKLHSQPGVVAAHRTIGGGARVFLMVKGFTLANFRTQIRLLLQKLDTLVGYAHDPSTVDPARLTFPSSDPDAWCLAPEACAEPFYEVPATPSGYEKMLKHVLSRHPLEEGHRNDTFLKLGAATKFYGYTPQQLQEIEVVAQQQYGDSEYTLSRVHETMQWGYRAGRREDYQQWCRDHHCPPRTPADFESTEASTVRPPLLPPAFYQQLPSFVTHLLAGQEPGRKCDMYILSTLGVLSSLMPGVRCRVRDREYSTHLFLLFIAAAASGKSIIMKPQKLAQKIDLYYREDSDTRIRAYRNQLLKWQAEQEQATKHGREADQRLNPGIAPEPQVFLSSGVCSRSWLIQNLRACPNGFLMMNSELDAFTESNNSQVGHFRADLRTVNMNEPTSVNYKNEPHTGVVLFPQLAYIASGTIDQYQNFMSGPENGDLSRFFCVLSESSTQWEPWADFDEEGSLQQDKVLQESSTYAASLFHYLEQSPTHVTMPFELRAKCDIYFGQLMDALYAKGLGHLDSLVKRGPILLTRLCGILVGLRKFETQSTEEHLEVLESEFNTMMYVVDLLIRHTLLASTFLPRRSHRSTPGEKAQNLSQETFFESILPESFSTAQFLQLCEQHLRLKKTAASALLKAWREEGRIELVSRGNYRKAPH